MNGILNVLASAPAARPVFFEREHVITAGQIRQNAVCAARHLEGVARVHLYTRSASLFASGLLAAASRALEVVCPAHLQPAYLTEIGADRAVVLTDLETSIGGATVRLAHVPPIEDDVRIAPCCVPDLIFYTSGVTGAPKAVRKSISQLDAEAAVLEELWPHGAERVHGTVSHQHIYGLLFRLFWPVLSGGTSSDNASDYWEQLSGMLSAGTTLVTGPAHLTRLPGPGVLDGSCPRRVFSSGAPLPNIAALAAKSLLGSVPIEVLGSTETGGIAWRQQVREDSLWTPIPGVKVSVDRSGVLNVQSPFAGANQPVSTGDIVVFDGAGFRLHGRGDRIAKINGKRVSLVRVEDAVAALHGVVSAAAVDLPSRKGDLAVVVELDADGLCALEAMGAFRLSRNLRRALAGILEPAERPKHWHFGTIPVNRQGKRTKEALRTMFDLGPDLLRGQGLIVRSDQVVAEIKLTLVAEMVWFQGHFPGQPVLPGIAQVHIASLWAERVWNWRPTGGNLSRLKFKRILRPGDTVELHLARSQDRRRLDFFYSLNGSVASDGRIEDGA